MQTILQRALKIGDKTLYRGRTCRLEQFPQRLGFAIPDRAGEQPGDFYKLAGVAALRSWLLFIFYGEELFDPGHRDAPAVPRPR